MTRTTSRLGAAFFVSVGIILALAATVLWFAMPVKVQAVSEPLPLDLTSNVPLMFSSWRGDEAQDGKQNYTRKDVEAILKGAR